MSDDLAGDDEIKAIVLRPLFGLVDHEDLAVQARIQVGTITVFWVGQDILVFLDDVDDMQFDTQLLGRPQGVVALGFLPVLLADRMGMPLHAEPGIEIDAFNMDALLENDPGGKHGVQPTGYQSDSFSG